MDARDFSMFQYTSNAPCTVDSGWSGWRPRKPGIAVPQTLARKAELALPEVSEVDVVRHYTNLSQMNFGVDTGFYPLGSCTMKYNPKVNEEVLQ